jgi:hypothetical protein
VKESGPKPNEWRVLQPGIELGRARRRAVWRLR